MNEHNTLPQDGLLQVVEGLIDRTFIFARFVGAVDVPLEKAMQSGVLSNRRFVAFVLTSPAFMGLSNESASAAMGISLRGIEDHLTKLRRQFPAVADFERTWQDDAQHDFEHQHVSLDDVDETTIQYVF